MPTRPRAPTRAIHDRQAWTDHFYDIIALLKLEPVREIPRDTRSDGKYRRKLSKWLGEAELDEIFNQSDALSNAEKLRDHLSPILTGENAKEAIAASRWIVKEWGGIPTGLDSVAVWYKECNQYHRGDVHTFVNKMSEKRIASWSKILSFVDRQRYPIYDARNGAALNTILWEVGVRRYFPKVGTRNTRADDAFKIMDRRRRRPYTLNYFDYSSLIELIAREHFKDGNILNAELSLFNASHRILDDFFLKDEQLRRQAKERKLERKRSFIVCMDQQSVPDEEPKLPL